MPSYCIHCSLGHKTLTIFISALHNVVDDALGLQGQNNARKLVRLWTDVGCVRQPLDKEKYPAAFCQKLIRSLRTVAACCRRGPRYRFACYRYQACVLSPSGRQASSFAPCNHLSTANSYFKAHNNYNQPPERPPWCHLSCMQAHKRAQRHSMASKGHHPSPFLQTDLTATGQRWR